MREQQVQKPGVSEKQGYFSFAGEICFSTAP